MTKESKGFAREIFLTNLTNSNLNHSTFSRIKICLIQSLHPAGTSKDSDKCDLSKDSEIAPLTLGSMDNSFFYHLFCFTQESYLSKDLGEIYIWKNL